MTKYYAIIRIKKSGKVKGVSVIVNSPEAPQYTSSEGHARTTLDYLREHNPDKLYQLVSWEA